MQQFITCTEPDDDYTSASNMIAIVAGFMGGTQPFPIEIVPDNSVEGNHSFFIRIIDDGTFTVGNISEIEVVIIDDDSKCIGVLLFRKEAWNNVLWLLELPSERFSVTFSK